MRKCVPRSRPKDLTHARPNSELKLAGVEGFEPPNGGIKTRCLTTWRHPSARVVDSGPATPETPARKLIALAPGARAAASDCARASRIPANVAEATAALRARAPRRRRRLTRQRR